MVRGQRAYMSLPGCSSFREGYWVRSPEKGGGRNYCRLLFYRTKLDVRVMLGALRLRAMVSASLLRSTPATYARSRFGELDSILTLLIGARLVFRSFGLNTYSGRAKDSN
jgi:hypothetical protein